MTFVLRPPHRVAWTLAAVSLFAFSMSRAPSDGQILRRIFPRRSRDIVLFNGRDLQGWEFVSEDPNARMEDTWSVDPKEHILVCRGMPMGYIRTIKDYDNFVLKLDWRFNPVTRKEGNSGVFVRMVGPDRVWPKSVECQLQSGQAGDFWLIDGFRLDTPIDRRDPNVPRHRLRSATNEKPVGEWNHYEIRCDGGTITLKVNGKLLNEGINAEESAGKICLQSEGTEIHFRDIRLTPLKPRRKAPP